MKPFAAVAYAHYYPSGGLDNLKGVFETKEEARAYLREHHQGADNLEVHDLRKSFPGLWEEPLDKLPQVG